MPDRSPSTHLGSPKVPENEIVAGAFALGDIEDRPTELAVRESQAVLQAAAVVRPQHISVSALLSDEVVEALAKRDTDWAGTAQALANPDRYPETLSAWRSRQEKILARARADLQAVVEQVGGASG